MNRAQANTPPHLGTPQRPLAKEVEREAKLLGSGGSGSMGLGEIGKFRNWEIGRDRSSV